MWERGLKDDFAASYADKVTVAPYVGAWIERIWLFTAFMAIKVAPYVGAWIESVRVTMRS